MKLYSNIKKRRKELGMTQKELASKCGYEHHTMICKIEKGEIDISVGKLKEIAKALDISVMALLEWSDFDD